MIGSLGSVGSHTILRSYAILHDPTYRSEERRVGKECQ